MKVFKIHNPKDVVQNWGMEEPLKVGTCNECDDWFEYQVDIGSFSVHLCESCLKTFCGYILKELLDLDGIIRPESNTQNSQEG